MKRLLNTVPNPAPEPAILTVAASAPVRLAALSESLTIVLFWKALLGISEVKGQGAELLKHLLICQCLWLVASAPLQRVIGSAAER